MRFALLLWLAWQTCPVFADGKVLSTHAQREVVTIPDQQALIHWSGGVERLVIQTSFTGAGTNFAWVVPLPAPPVIEEASSGLFPTLNYLFQPKLEHSVSPWYAAAIWLLGLTYLLRNLRPGQRPGWRLVLVIVALCACAFTVDPALGVFVSPLLVTGVAMVLARREPVYTILILVLVGMLLGSMMLPSLSRSKAGAVPSPDKGVQVLQRQRAGAYDVVTLGASQATQLAEWLQTNGFYLPSNALPVIADYTSRGWVFIAAKLAPTASHHQTQTIRPLSFTFESAKPVYPMRLTGVDGAQLSVDLYVFGPGTASAGGFQLRYSSKPVFPAEQKNWRWRKPAEMEIVHPALREMVNGAAVATKLQAVMSPAAQDRDIIIDWLPFTPATELEYSYRAAAVHAANWAGGLLVLGFAVLIVLRWTKLIQAGPTQWLPWAGAILVGGLVYLSLEKVQVHSTKPHSIHSNLQKLCLSALGASEPQEVREAVTTLVRQHSAQYANPLVGGLVQEQDSPGNYTIRDLGDELQFIGYDFSGAPHELLVLPKSHSGTNGPSAAKADRPDGSSL